jgi:hypothetical protein
MEQQRFVRHLISPHLELGDQLETTDEQPV